MYDILTLNAMKVAELKSVAENIGIPNAEKLKKQDLVLTIMDRQSISSAPAAAPAPTAIEANESSAASESNDSSERPKKTRERKPYKASEKEEIPAKEEVAIDIPTEQKNEQVEESAPAVETKPEIPFLVLAKKDGQPRPQHPRVHAGPTRKPVVTVFPESLARRSLPPVHGLDGDEQLEDQPLGGTAHVGRRDIQR
jgi:hypothetical protein